LIPEALFYICSCHILRNEDIMYISIGIHKHYVSELNWKFC